MLLVTLPFPCLLGREPYEPVDLVYKRTQSRLLTGCKNEGKLFLAEIKNAKPSLGF